MPEFTAQTLEIFGWLISAMVLVFFFLIPVAYLLVELIEQSTAKLRGLR